LAGFPSKTGREVSADTIPGKSVSHFSSGNNHAKAFSFVAGHSTLTKIFILLHLLKKGNPHCGKAQNYVVK
jgi:hypothetical protein